MALGGSGPLLEPLHPAIIQEANPNRMIRNELLALFSHVNQPIKNRILVTFAPPGF
jgi:hypothetical protein